MDRSTALFKEVGSNHSIVLYWMISCCGWIGGRALRCSDQKTASGVRAYSLRKPRRMSSPGIFGGSVMDGLAPFTVVVGAVFFYSGCKGSY